MYANINKKIRNNELLGFPLTEKQDVLVNYLIPALGAGALYTFLFSSDVALIHRHYKDERYLTCWITLIIVYLPVVGSLVITLSSLELWPEFQFGGTKNLKWFLTKTIQHLMFPIWSLWRFAERIFWSIEAFRAETAESRNEAISVATSPRTVELYFFLQAFLQCLPQILFQLYLLMRHTHKTDEQTAQAQFLSIGLNLTKLAITVTYYQRFKTNKLTGSQYPWYKAHKYKFDAALDEVTLRRKIETVPRATSSNDEEDIYEPVVNRRSSDIYLEPEIRGSYLPAYSSRIISTSKSISKFSTISEDSSQPDFNIRRVMFIKGLPEDDLAGKLVAFCWWSAFLLARVLAISAFQYFYPTQVLYILTSHFLLTLGLLCYDAKSDEVTRSKALFFIFVAYVYLFCIIEFKIKFKKAKFIYYGFFTVVFLENLLMCMIWWYGDLDSIESDFWFRYIFYIIFWCSLSSFVSMIFYFSINKPDKVVVGHVML